jgi:hypothetical protein
MWSCVIVLLALAASLHAQGAFANPDFEKGSPGAVPESWLVPTAFAAYQATWASEGCKQGKGCSEIAPGPNAGAAPGNLMQIFDAAPYRGKQIRYRAAVSVAEGGRAGLWLRVDRPGGRMGFFDNMKSRPIMTQGEWQYFDINGFVHPDAEEIALGLLVYSGKARFDDASLISGRHPYRGSPGLSEPISRHPEGADAAGLAQYGTRSDQSSSVHRLREVRTGSGGRQGSRTSAPRIVHLDGDRARGSRAMTGNEPEFREGRIRLTWTASCSCASLSPLLP